MISIKKLDSTILTWIQTHLKTRKMDRFMLFSTRMGDWGAIWLLIAVVLLLSSERRGTGVALVLCVAICAIVGNFAIKPLFQRTRPCNLDESRPLLLTRPYDSSFPSCHTLTSFAAAVTIFQAGGILGMASLVFASLISFSRMYLYVHYPSDVLIGAVMGIAAGKLFF